MALMLTQEQGEGATSPPRRSGPAASRGRVRAIVAGLALVAASGLGVVPGSGGASAALAQTGANPPPPFSYWLVAADGGVFSFGGMPYRGSAGSQHLTKPIVGMAAKATATGYWLVASDGGIFSYGDAGFFGSTGAIHLNKAIVGMAPTPSGLGYWLVASDGGIFTYGDAAFYGSTGNLHLTQPIVGMTATSSGHGYWMVASDGGIFAFGDAPFKGSTGAVHLNKPIVGMTPTSSSQGYWMVASDGGIFAFGDAKFLGSAGSVALRRPVVGMAVDGTGLGYWLVASDGGIFSYGDAAFRGSTGALKLAAPIVGMASGPDSNPYIPHSRGYDISWPQCGGTYPARPFDFAIVGVNDGLSYTTNPCFDSEWTWAGQGGSVYLNVNSPTGPNTAVDSTGPAGSCGASDLRCQSYNWGYKSAQQSVQTVRTAGASPLVWWLDVEIEKAWSSDQVANTRVVAGFVDALQQQGLTVGIYSTPYQWGVITGGASFGLPLWEAGTPPNDPEQYCASFKQFAGGQAWLTQYSNGDVDIDTACA